MKILIENQETAEFLTAATTWTKNPLEGKVFSGTAVALRSAKQEPIGKFNVVGHIPETDQFINLSQGRGTGVAEK